MTGSGSKMSVRMRLEEDDFDRAEAIAQRDGMTPAAVRLRAMRIGLQALEKEAGDGVANPAGNGPGNGSKSNPESPLKNDPEIAALRSKIGDLERRVSQASNASNGTLVMLSWVMPRLCTLTDEECCPDTFLKELMRKSPADLFRAGRNAGIRVGKGESFPKVLSRIPQEIGLDTRKAMGITLEDFKAQCEAADEQERRRSNGKKRPR